MCFGYFKGSVYFFVHDNQYTIFSCYRAGSGPHCTENILRAIRAGFAATAHCSGKADRFFRLDHKIKHIGGLFKGIGSMCNHHSGNINPRGLFINHGCQFKHQLRCHMWTWQIRKFQYFYRCLICQFRDRLN